MTAEREKVKNGEITDEHVVVIRNLIKVEYCCKGPFIRLALTIYYLTPSDLPSSSGWTDTEAQESGSQRTHPCHPKRRVFWSPGNQW